MKNIPSQPTPLAIEELIATFNPLSGSMTGGARIERRLSQLDGIFHDRDAWRRMVEANDPLIYTVETREPAQGEGDLHIGIGTIMPGRVGDEYFMTRGHYHDWRPAAEVYVGLAGHGLMLLEHEATGETRLLALEPHGIVYVPGYTAHRTINTGAIPLTYLGIYPARAGHDYGAIAERNFRAMVVERNGEPVALDR